MAILELTARVAENEVITKNVRSTIKNISQAVNSISGKIPEPRTPEQTDPVQQVDETPQGNHQQHREAGHLMASPTSTSSPTLVQKPHSCTG
jgi:hypothetical protein